MKIFILSFLILTLLFAQASFAGEKAPVVKAIWRKVLSILRNPVKELTPPPAKTEPRPQPQPEEPAPPEKPEKHPLAEMSEEEIIERIRNMLETSPEVPDFIPELKVVFDEEGNAVSISYKVEGFFKDIGELDKDTLIKIHVRVNNERVRIQTERIQRQLEAIRASQNIPKPPQVYIPPQPPKIPKPPQSPPRIPAPPPAPKRQ